MELPFLELKISPSIVFGRPVIYFYKFNLLRKEGIGIIKQLLLKPDKQANIKNRIEEYRNLIHDRIYLGENFVADDEMIKMSQDLDKLIVEYMCAQGKSSCKNS